MSLDPLYVFLGELSVQDLCPLFNWDFCLPGVELCEFFIYFWDQTLLQGIISKYTVGSLFILILFSLAMHKLFNLMRSHLFIPSFMSLALEDIPVKILLHEIFENFLLMFSWRTLMTSWLIFKSFIHLEFIFVYGVYWWSIFFFLHVALDLPTPFVEESIFAPFYSPASFVKYWLTIKTWVYFWAPYSFPLSMCLLLWQYQSVLITMAL